MSSNPKSPRGLTSEEQALWRKVTRTVKSDRAPDRDEFQTLMESGQPSPIKPTPHVRSSILGPSRSVQLEAEQGKQPSSSRPPVNRGQDKRVRRGRVEVESRIDLHGMTQSHARNALLGFLIQAWNRGDRAVLVITGKGVNPHIHDQRRFEPWDPGARDLPGVLRRALPRWLVEPDFSAIVSGYASAHARHGGAGAWYVFLKS